MRVLFHESADNIFTGYINALINKGESVVVWHPEVKPTFDLFYEYKPDVVFIQSNDVSDTILRCIQRYNPQVRIFLNAYSDVSDKYSRKAFAIERRLTKSLASNTTKFYSIYPDALTSKWGLSIEHVPIGVDDVLYRKVNERDVYLCDVAVIEDNRGVTFEDVEWLRESGRIKLFGDGWGQYPEGLGKIAPEEIANVIVSADGVKTYNPYTGIPELVKYLNSEPMPTYTQLLDKVI